MNTEIIKDSIKEKYDREVSQYDEIFQTKGGKHFIKKKLLKAESYGFIKKGQNVLEIGSATGVFSFEYEKYDINLTAIDLSPENIKWAKNKAANKNSSIEFQVADVEILPFPDNYFDGILSFSTLRYVPNIDLALKEIYRVLKPGGYIIIDFPNKKCPWFGGLKKKVLGREHIFDNHYYWKDIVIMMSKTNFKNVKMKRGLFVPKSTPNNLFWLFSIIEFFAEKLPVLKTYSAIIFIGANK
jgi:ubiquinone/menaquinone biosynthesis C-methylase UbiE